MKLGTETNSVMNHLCARGTKGQPDPVVGMGATLLGWTDRDAATIVDVFTAGSSKLQYIVIQEDLSKLVSGSTMSESQEYEFLPNPNANKRTFRFRREAWEEVHKNEAGRWVKSGSQGLRIGERDKYRDPCF